MISFFFMNFTMTFDESQPMPSHRIHLAPISVVDHWHVTASRQSSDEWVILKIAVYTTPCQLSLLAVGMVKTGLDLFSRAALSSWPGLRRYTGSARPNLEPPANGCSLARQWHWTLRRCGRTQLRHFGETWSNVESRALRNDMCATWGRFSRNVHFFRFYFNDNFSDFSVVCCSRNAKSDC